MSIPCMFTNNVNNTQEISNSFVRFSYWLHICWMCTQNVVFRERVYFTSFKFSNNWFAQFFCQLLVFKINFRPCESKSNSDLLVKIFLNLISKTPFISIIFSTFSNIKCFIMWYIIRSCSSWKIWKPSIRHIVLEASFV